MKSRVYYAIVAIWSISLLAMDVDKEPASPKEIATKSFSATLQAALKHGILCQQCHLPGIAQIIARATSYYKDQMVWCGRHSDKEYIDRIPFGGVVTYLRRYIGQDQSRCDRCFCRMQKPYILSCCATEKNAYVVCNNCAKNDTWHFCGGTQCAILFDTRLHDELRFKLKDTKRFQEILPYVCLDATRAGDIAVVADCLAHGISVNMDGGWKALIYHAKTAQMVDFLVNHGANVNMVDHCNRTPIYTRMFDDSKEPSIIEALLAHGANVTIADTSSITPLHVFISFIRAKFLKNKTPILAIFDLLKKGGADFNAKDCMGITPLHRAIVPIGENIEVVKTVIQYGARFDVINNEGKTPLDQARKYEYYKPYLEFLETTARVQAIAFITKLLEHWTTHDAGTLLNISMTC